MNLDKIITHSKPWINKDDHQSVRNILEGGMIKNNEDFTIKHKEKFTTNIKLNVILSDLLKTINKNDIKNNFKILEDAPLVYNRH